MDNYSKIYWLTRLDGFGDLVSFFVGICFTYTILITIFYFFSRDSDQFETEDKIKERAGLRKKLTSKIRWVLPLGFLFLFIRVLMPSKEDVIMIYAGGKTMDFVEKDTSISKIPYQTTKIISDYLDSKIKELDK